MEKLSEACVTSVCEDTALHHAGSMTHLFYSRPRHRWSIFLISCRLSGLSAAVILDRSVAIWMIYHFRHGDFFPEWATSHTKMSPNKNSSTPSVGTQNGTLKSPPTLFRWQVPNLETLACGDLPVPGTSTSSIMPFHNHVSKLVHWFFDASQGQQIWARGLIFVEYRNTL